MRLERYGEYRKEEVRDKGDMRGNKLGDRNVQ